MIAFSLMVTVALILLMRKNPLNRALDNISGIKYLYISKELMNVLCLIDHKKNSIPKKQPDLQDIHYNIVEISKNPSGLPFLNHYVYLWAIFLSGILGQTISIILGPLKIGNLQDQINGFALTSFSILIALLRIGMVTCFNRPLHKRFAVGYSILFTVLSFITLRRFSLGIFEFRPIFIDFFELPSLVIDGALAFVIGILAFSLSTPMLYELFAYQMAKENPSYIKFFSYANTFYLDVMRRKRLIIKLIYVLTPFIPVLAYFLSPCLSFTSSDLAISIGFVVIECMIAISKLLDVKNKAQILMYSPLERVLTFNAKRTRALFKESDYTIERSVYMLPLSEISLSFHPMLMIFLSFIYASSFFMSDIQSMICRHFSLFLMAAIDFVLGGYRIFGMFISNE